MTPLGKNRGYITNMAIEDTEEQILNDGDVDGTGDDTEKDWSEENTTLMWTVFAWCAGTLCFCICCMACCIAAAKNN